MGVLERRDGGTRDAPQSPQNLNWGGLEKPHPGHRAVTGVPHSPQNFRPSGLSKPQLGQRMGAPSGASVQAARKRASRSPDAPLRREWWTVCQYSTPGPVSSEKHAMAPDAGVEGRDDDTSGVGTA